MRIFKSNRKECTRAQTLVEFALVLPILLMIIYGLLEVGRLIFIYSTIVSAAREAARYGSATGLVSGTEQYKDCTGIRDAAQRVDFLGAIEDVNIVIEYYDDAGTLLYKIDTPTCPSPSAVPTVPSKGRIKVTVTATFTPLAAIVPLNQIPIASANARTIIGSVQIIP